MDLMITTDARPALTAAGALSWQST